ncbi:MAG TPA: hypothetical protein VMH82_07735 [Myxococcota bacterium]|nr:hypothetical protein [Myxococcota bacterium]
MSDAEPRRSDWRVWLGLVLTAGWLTAGFVYIDRSIGWDRFFHQSLGDVGQFIEGAFAPLAFLWLVLGLSLQQSELAGNNRAIQRQYELMQRTAEHAEVQTRAIAANELHARQDTFIDLAQMVGRQLDTIAGFLYMSSQGSAGDGVVSDEEMDALWSRLSTGEQTLFCRRMISLRFAADGDRAARELFWGTPIRSRHSENFLLSFERLLGAAEGCDPDGMIMDALRGGAQGRVYRIIRELRELPAD